MNDSNCCRWRQIPFTCIECPIRQVQMSCWLNTDFGDWKFWDRRKQKWPVIGKKEQQNRGLLMEICRKSCCNPELIKYILVATAHSAEKCMCPHTDPFPKFIPVVPLSQTYSTCGKRENDDYGYAFEHWFPQYVLRHLNKSSADDQKPKIFEKITPDWLDSLYDLYNSIVGPKPEDDLELYLQELLKRQQDDELRHGEGEGEGEDESYDIDREGRFEQQQPEDEDDDENNTDRDKDDKQDAKKKRKRSIRKSDEERRKHLHNPVDIFYFDPLTESQRQAYRQYLPRTLGPRKYTPPPEDAMLNQKTFDPQNNNKTTRFGPGYISRMGNHDRNDRNRSVNSFFQGGFPYLNPRQLATFAAPIATQRQSHFKFQAAMKKQMYRAPPKGRSRNLPTLSERKSHFHTFGYS